MAKNYKDYKDSETESETVEVVVNTIEAVESVKVVLDNNEAKCSAVMTKLNELIDLTSDSAELVLSANKLGLDVYAIQTMNKHFIKAKTFSEAVEAIAKRLDA